MPGNSEASRTSATNGPHNGERLSWGDALFLYLERAGMPLNIACVSIFEGDIPLDECRHFIESKLPLLPRYYQRAVTPPLNVGFPSWEDDPDFDIRNHIKAVHLKRGTDAELKREAGKILSRVMDRSHPLWDITLLHGLRGNRMAMLVRVHHCLADGIAGVALMQALLDPLPKARTAVPRKPHVAQPQRDSLSLLLEGCLSSYSDLLERVLRAQSDLAGIFLQTVGGGWPDDDFAKYLPELTAPTERMFFNKVYRGPQEFAWAKIPTDAIKKGRKICGATHNDVVLALMTTTIRRYLESHGEQVRGRLFRMMVPVNVRLGGHGGELGNRILFLPVTAPLDIRSPHKLLDTVHQRTDFLKRTHVAEWLGLAAGLLGAVPAPLQALIGPLASTLPISLCNMICTNIHGPDEPLYLLGHKMTELYPYVPVGGQMTLNCAVMSYCGVTYFGFSGDKQAAPDMRKLEKLLQTSAGELLKGSGFRPPEQKKRKKSVRVAQTTEDKAPPPSERRTSNAAESVTEGILPSDETIALSTAAD
jgi:WS/DGAT/MGAT family acyltransferase